MMILLVFIPNHSGDMANRVMLYDILIPSYWKFSIVAGVDLIKTLFMHVG